MVNESSKGVESVLFQKSRLMLALTCELSAAASRYGLAVDAWGLKVKPDGASNQVTFYRKYRVNETRKVESLEVSFSFDTRIGIRNISVRSSSLGETCLPNLDSVPETVRLLALEIDRRLKVL